MRSVIVLFYMGFNFPRKLTLIFSPVKGNFYNCTVVVEVRKFVMLTMECIDLCLLVRAAYVEKNVCVDPMVQ